MYTAPRYTTLEIKYAMLRIQSLILWLSISVGAIIPVPRETSTFKTRPNVFLATLKRMLMNTNENIIAPCAFVT